jgi:NAD+ kinase
MMIEGYLEKVSGEKKEFFALNDVVITSPQPSKMVKVNASIDGERFNSYRGDGLIISTPTGSTAYNLAAGGPVVYPLTKAFILTPISAHSLTNQRPLVVPTDFDIELDTEKYDAIAMIDGQVRYDIEEGDSSIYEEQNEVLNFYIEKREITSLSFVRNYIGVIDIGRAFIST